MSRVWGGGEGVEAGEGVTELCDDLDLIMAALIQLIFGRQNYF